jgi:hypothetical protein
MSLQESSRISDTRRSAPSTITATPRLGRLRGTDNIPIAILIALGFGVAAFTLPRLRCYALAQLTRVRRKARRRLCTTDCRGVKTALRAKERGLTQRRRRGAAEFPPRTSAIRETKQYYQLGLNAREALDQGAYSTLVIVDSEALATRPHRHIQRPLLTGNSI